ncbi:MAG: MoaD/ThiS family protein [Actinobacteria bacterium]|nr:MoaD/ThiS family protein [Actinomycetota bacterium]
MKVRVRLRCGLERYAATRDGYEEVALALDSTVSHLLERYQFSRGEVSLVVVDGEQVNLDARLRDGCLVEIYPIFGGG